MPLMDEVDSMTPWQERAEPSASEAIHEPSADGVSADRDLSPQYGATCVSQSRR